MDEATNLETEVAPDDEIIEEQTEAEAEDSEQELDEFGEPVEPEQAEDDDDEDEVEINGKKYRVPKDAALRQADYTRKTQEIAEQRKQYEAAIERLNSTSEVEMRAIREIGVIEAELASYQDVDWDTYDEQDPIAALKLRQRISDLQNAHREAQGQHARARAAAAQVAQQETAKRLEEGQAVLQREIPGWGAEKATAIRTFAKEAYGLSDAMIAQIDDPIYVKILHDAMEGRAVSKKAATVKKVTSQQAIKPAVTVKGKGGNPPRGLSDDLSAEEWIKRRNAQVRKRNQ